jgi:two-component system, OmpR family, response regulator
MDNKESEQLQILIAESDSDLLTLFKEYLSSLGVKTETATSGQEAIEQFLKSKENKRPYNAIVLDTHLQNPSGLDVAKKIRSEKPDQKVVIITTMPRKYLPEEYLKNARIEDKYILSIPFNLSKLANVLKN